MRFSVVFAHEVEITVPVQSKGSMKRFVNICKWLAVSLFVASITTGLSNAQSTNCTPQPTGLVSWWKAEGNGVDSISGNTAYGALLPDGVTFAPGKVGQAFQLDNTNAYLVVPASPSLNVGTGGLTVEGWIKVASVDGFHPIVEWHGNSRYEAGVQLWLNSNPSESGALFASVVDTNHNTHNLLSAEGIVLPKVFQHVALTYDNASGVAALYLNGAVVAQSNIGNIVPLTSSDLYFGHRPLDVPGDWTYGTTLGGLLDEMSIYNRALSQSEIAAIYHAGSAGKCDLTSSGDVPVITHQPTNQTVAAGATATFTVTATGTAPLYYQWFGPSSAVIPGANTSTLALSNVQPANAGSYFVLVTNSFGSAQSSNAVLTLTAGDTNSCTPPPSGLVSLWKGEINTLDSAGTNNGFFNGPASYAFGKVDAAFYYNATNGYVEVPATPSLNVGQGLGFTLEAWIQPADLQNQMPIFEWKYNTNNNFTGAMFWVSATAGGPGCLFADILDSSANDHFLYSVPGIVTADYQHVALTYDKSSGMAAIYRNGVLVTNKNLGSFTPNTTGNLLLGERTFLGGQPQFHYVGGLDEMSIYNRALSQSEIAAIYHAGSAGKCPVATGPHSSSSSQPLMNLSFSANSPVLTWPVSASDFTLQSTDDLTPPVHWTNVPTTPQTNGDNIEIMLPKGGKRGYFRLYHP
jgi:hypothetical protein